MLVTYVPMWLVLSRSKCEFLMRRPKGLTPKWLMLRPKWLTPKYIINVKT